MEIRQDFISKGRRNRPGYKMTPRYITVHDTANTQSGADAAAHARYLKGDTAASIPASWHFTVDDKEIRQHLPVTEVGWHAGDGSTGTGNRQSIGIEICENRDGNRAQAEKNAAWLIAKLLKDFGLSISAVVQHNRWSGKNCPRVLRSRKGGWEGFLSQIESYLKAGDSKLPVITRTIGYYVGDTLGRRKKVSGETGYLINNATYTRTAHTAGLFGGTVEPGGDRITVVVPERVDEAELKKLKAERDSLKGKLKQIADIAKS